VVVVASLGSCGSTSYGGHRASRCLARWLASLVAQSRLNRQFTVDTSAKAWVTDITYVRTWQGSL